MKKKILIIGLFASIMLVAPISTANNLNTKVDNGTIEEHEIELLSSVTEIITFIHAGAGNGGFLKVIESGSGIFFKRVEIWADDPQTSFIDLGGFWRYLIIAIPFRTGTSHLIAPRCLILHHGPLYPGAEYLYAIAIGDIEYS